MASEEILGGDGKSEEEYPIDAIRSNQDHRIIARLAKRKEWVIPEEAFELAPKTMVAVLKDEKSDGRERTQACRTLVMMGNANTAVGSIDIRVNQALAVTVPPAAPDEVDTDMQPAFIEQVVADDLSETVEVLESLGLLERYVEQVKTQSVIPSNGAPHNGNGKTNGKPSL